MDSARSWVVAASCAWIMLFNFVIVRSAAVFYVAILQSFHATREQASWPITITTALFNITAPVAGILARHVALWKLIVTACAASGLAVSACYFADSVVHVTILLGAAHGCSVAFVILCYTVINAHFDRYKAVASGIGNAGITLGGLIFPPVAQFLFDEYGTRGGFLLCGAIMLNGAAGALVLRSASEGPKERPRDLVKTESADSCLYVLGSNSSAVSDSSSPVLKNLHSIFNRLPSKSSGRQLSGSFGVKPESDEIFLQLRDPSFGNSDAVLQLPPITSKVRKYSMGGSLRKERTLKGQGEMSDLHSSTNGTNHQPPIDPVINADGLGKAFVLESYPLLSFIAFPKFYLLALSLALIYLNMATYATVIIDFAMDRDIAKWNAIYLVVLYTSADLVARLVSGVITDKRIVTRSTMMAANYLCWGGSLCLIPLCRSYHLQVLLSITAGWSNGVVYVLASVVCMDVAGADKFSVCYGMACFLAGLPLLARPALVGYYRDGMGDYQGLFVIQGLLTVSVGVLWLALSVQEKCVNKSKAAIPKAETPEELVSERL